MFLYWKIDVPTYMLMSVPKGSGISLVRNIMRVNIFEMKYIHKYIIYTWYNENFYPLKHGQVLNISNANIVCVLCKICG